MDRAHLAHQRRANQQLNATQFQQPHALVHWMGALQAQDYLGSLWAVGSRMPSSTEQQIEQALADRTIIRTWPLRGTIHIVAASDVRWMLTLLAARVVQRMQGRLRQLALDGATLAQSADLVTTALRDQAELTRSELLQRLEQAGINTTGQRGYTILVYLAHQQLICFGARSGKQPTFTLLDRWVPTAPTMPREEALARLAQRYFTSHGPATIRDLSWWAGLTINEAKQAVALVADQFEMVMVDQQQYYGNWNTTNTDPHQASVDLLAPFDELLLGYQDRSPTVDPIYTNLITPGSNGIFNPVILYDGQAIGTWRRTIKPRMVDLAFQFFPSWDQPAPAGLEETAARYRSFLTKG